MRAQVPPKEFSRLAILAPDRSDRQTASRVTTHFSAHEQSLTAGRHITTADRDAFRRYLWSHLEADELPTAG